MDTRTQQDPSMRLSRDRTTGPFAPGAYRKSPCETSLPVGPGNMGSLVRTLDLVLRVGPGSVCGNRLARPYHGSPQGTSSPTPYVGYLPVDFYHTPGCVGGLPTASLHPALSAITPWDSHSWYGWGVSVGNPSPGPIGDLPRGCPVPHLLPARLPPHWPVPGAC